jgi:hypothetical protein
MPRFFNRKQKVGVVLAVCLLASAGVAYAYWTTSGSGSGGATTAEPDAITINQTSTVDGLFPGGPAQALSGDFDNPNPGSIFVATINAVIGDVAGPNITPAAPCAAADYQLNGFPVAVNDEISSGSGVGAWSGGSIQLLNSGSDQNGCKGATVTISYTVA